jgi:REP element-mobilizing transposase RayT
LPTSGTKSFEQEVLQDRTDRHIEPAFRPRPADIEEPVVSALEPLHQALTKPLNEITVRPAAGPGKVVLEPFSRRPYDLSYACLMVPRFSTHRLHGDVVEALRTKMYEICVSFGWRLEYVMVRPEYLQWVISAPATTPPSRSVRTIREQTSRKIFEDFPHYKESNVGEDFWAPGYLVLVGPTPHPPEIIIEFIRLTRQQQGFLPNPGK